MKETVHEIAVSVVIPVFNRSPELQRVLAALARQTLPRDSFEVLVCDDGSSEDLATLVADIRRNSELPVRHLRQSNQGAGSARNLGLTIASGEFVAFTDSDCEPEETWLAELLTPFSDPQVGITGGGINYVNAEYLSGRCVNFLMSSSLGAGGARDPQAAIRMVYYPRTLNMAVRRNLAVAAGGFPTTSHGEDLEFSGRIMRQGFRAEFAPTARVLHNEKRTWLQVLREAFRKGRARVRLARQHGIHEFLHAVPALFCLYLIGLPPIGWAVCDWPLVWYSVWIPAACYLLVLLTLSVQSALSFRSFRVGLATPFYAVLLHIGYGTGYLTGCVKRLIP